MTQNMIPLIVQTYFEFGETKTGYCDSGIFYPILRAKMLSFGK